MPDIHFYIYFALSKYYVHFKDQSIKFMVFNAKILSNNSTLMNSLNKIIIDLCLLVL
jgi:hypothetical protein